MAKNVLVTGCSGFLGSHLCQHHLDAGDFVFGIDNFISSRDDSKHFKRLLGNKNFHFFHGFGDSDICNTSFLHDVDYHLYLIKAKLDIVYNFACPASPPIYQKWPIKTLLTCTQGFSNIIELARKNNPKVVIVQASTSEVYGDPDVSPQPETYRGHVNPYGIRSNYDEGKRAAEALSYDYLNTFGVDVRVVRIFNTYGPNMDMHDGRVVTNFIKQALNNEDITLFGSGEQTRSFCFVDDLISGVVKMAHLDHNPKTPINLGNPVEFDMIELAQRVKHLIPESTSNLVYKPLPGDDPRQRKPDITLAKKILNWEPKVKLEDGLVRMIAWAKENNW
jgi:UDP-glucuronate decarboxylase